MHPRTILASLVFALPTGVISIAMLGLRPGLIVYLICVLMLMVFFPVANFFSTRKMRTLAKSVTGAIIGTLKRVQVLMGERTIEAALFLTEDAIWLFDTVDSLGGIIKLYKRDMLKANVVAPTELLVSMRDQTLKLRSSPQGIALLADALVQLDWTT